MSIVVFCGRNIFFGPWGREMAASNILAGATSLVVSDLKQSIEWYQSCLEFKAQGLDWTAKPTMCLLERGNGILLLNYAPTPSKANRHCRPGSSICDAYFWVEDLSKLELAIKVSGNRLYAGPTKRSYGTVELMVVDPNDYLICFGQYR